MADIPIVSMYLPRFHRNFVSTIDVSPGTAAQGCAGWVKSKQVS
jgi:hypothetical protein